MSRIEICGRWVIGSNAGERVKLIDVQAGLVCGLRADGTRISGPPSAFVADSGETGEALLGLLLPTPKAAALLRGALRESLAAAYSVATLGQQETRAWDDHYRYVADDGEGNYGIVLFDTDGSAGVLYDHDIRRNVEIDGVSALAPPGQRERLRSLIELPIFIHNGRRAVTAVFWTEADLLCGPEPWHKIYTSGGELLRRELMMDHEWRDEAGEHYGLGDSLIDIIVRIIDRHAPQHPIYLTTSEVPVLIPGNAPFREIALEQLFSGRVFRPC